MESGIHAPAGRASTEEWLGGRLRELVGSEMGDVVGTILDMPQADMAGYLDAMGLPGEELAAEAQRRLAAAVALAAGSPPGLGVGAGGQTSQMHIKGAIGDDDDVDAKYRLTAAASGKAAKGGSAGKRGGGSAGGVAGSETNGGAAARGRAAKKAAATSSAPDPMLAHDGTPLLPGRRLCGCNAVRHPLLFNCLSCGNIVCAQQGAGTCLACGNDPDKCAPALAAANDDGDGGQGSTAAASTAQEQAQVQAQAQAHRDKLLEYERSGAKRTTVIDDQTDYWDTSGDAWLSAAEREAAARARAQAVAEVERKRRELTVTIDVTNRAVVQESAGYRGAGEQAAGGGGSAAKPGEQARIDGFATSVGRAGTGQGAGEGSRGGVGARGVCHTSGGEGEGSSVCGDGSGGASRQLSGPLPAASAGAAQAGAGASPRLGLANPWLAADERPKFVRRERRAGGAEGSGAAGDADGVRARAASEGLRHSVLKVQHDDPWLAEFLQQEQALGGVGQLERQAADAQARREARLRESVAQAEAEAEAEARFHAERAADEAAGDAPPCGVPGSAGAGVSRSGDSTGAGSGEARECLSMHQPWASLLVAGIKRIEGRSWPTRHRGTLWIAATARKPTELEIASVEQMYVELAAARGEPPPVLPAVYPTSALLGTVQLVDCVPNAQYAARQQAGAAQLGEPREENDSPFLFIVEQPRALALPIASSGHHKIYKLDPRVAADARAALLPPAGQAQ